MPLLVACRRGWTAQQLYTAVRPEEFATGRSLFPVAAAQGSGQANADIFAQWVSAVYITLVQVADSFNPFHHMHPT